MSAHLYLVLALVSFAGACVLGAFRADLRRPIVITSLAGAIWGPVSEHWFLQDYWRPDGVFGNPWLEDILFGSGLAGVAAGLYPSLRRWTIAVSLDPPRRIATVAVFPFVYVAVMLGLQGLIGLNSILASMLFYALAAAYMLWRRPDLRAASLATAGGLAIVALAGYAVGLDVIVNGHQVLSEIWLLAGKPLGVTILGNVPLLEVMWWAAWGLFFGVVYEFATAARFVPPLTADRGVGSP